jgi:hypothetical protein
MSRARRGEQFAVPAPELVCQFSCQLLIGDVHPKDSIGHRWIREIGLTADPKLEFATADDHGELVRIYQAVVLPADGRVEYVNLFTS